MPTRSELSICAQVSLRYEARYLLPWVAWHTLLGFDRIILYMDDHNHLGVVDPAVQRRMLGHLSRAAHVTVHSQVALGQNGPGAQLEHCIFSARKHSVWMLSLIHI